MTKAGRFFRDIALFLFLKTLDFSQVISQIDIRYVDLLIDIQVSL